MKSLFSVPSG